MGKYLDRWKRLIFGPKVKSAANRLEDSLSVISAAESPWNVEVVNCIPMATTYVACTKSEEIARKFLENRNADGSNLSSVDTANFRRFTANLEYDHAHKNIPDGAIYRAQAMEDKWDISHYSGVLYFHRSWTGDLVFKVPIAWPREGQFAVREFLVAPVYSKEAEEFLVDQLDYLIRMHICYRGMLPAPVQEKVQSKDEMAMMAFSIYGRCALFATHARTRGLKGAGSADIERYLPVN